MRFLKNKSRYSYIYLCVIILVVSMLLSVLILYLGLTAQVQIQKRDMQSKLDGYVAEYATEVFDAIKQGQSYEKYIDYEQFKSGSYTALGFPSTVSEYAYENGNCVVSRPVVSVLKGNGFGLTAKYTATFPIKWNGKTYTSLSIPVTVTSYYKLK